MKQFLLCPDLLIHVDVWLGRKAVILLQLYLIYFTTQLEAQN